MGRALASSLLGDATIERPTREPVSRRARREQREREEAEALVAATPTVGEPPAPAPTPTPSPAPAPSSGTEIVPVRPRPRPATPSTDVERQDAGPTRRGPSAPSTADPNHFQVARPRVRPEDTADTTSEADATAAPTDLPPRRDGRPRSGPPPGPAPKRAPSGPSTRPAARREPEPQPTPRATGPLPEDAMRPAPEPSRPRPESARPESPRPRVRSLEQDPFASLPWPVDEEPEGRLRPRRPGGIRDLEVGGRIAAAPAPAGTRQRASRSLRDLVRPSANTATTATTTATTATTDSADTVEITRVAAPRTTPRPAPRPTPRPVEVDDVDTVVEDDDEVETTLAQRLGRSVLEWALVLGAAAVVALVLQRFVVQLYEIPSESMVPTLQEQDRVAVNKLAYVIGGGVERGDVIVFKRPESERTDDPDQPAQLIKRVIGLPSDVVEARGGVVYINGKPLAETGKDHYLSASVVTNNLPEPVTVPAGHVFVMGDNRERSHDSRFFGAIPESDIIGRAVVIAWPFDRWGTL